MRSAVVKDKAKDKNVIHYRLKRAGCRFEISVHRDRLPTDAAKAAKGFQYNWTDLLVAPEVFSNAAKGTTATKEDIAKAFPVEGPTAAAGSVLPLEQIYRLILEKGEAQLSLEDRQEAVAEEKGSFRNIATDVAKLIFVPKDPAAKPPAGGLRLERYSVDDIERELKNCRFKPPQAGRTPEDVAVDAIVAIWAGQILPVLRAQQLMTVPLADAAQAPQVAAFLRTFRPGYCKVHAASLTPGPKAAILCSVDKAYNIKEAMPPALAAAVGEIAFKSPYIPTSPEDDLTSEAPPSEAAKAEAEKKGKGKAPAAAAAPAPGGKKSKDGGKEDGKDAGKHLATLGSLEDELNALKKADNDSDDEGRGKKKGKAAKPAAKAAPAPKQAQPAPKKGGNRGRGDDDDDAEEEDAPPTALVAGGKKKNNRRRGGESDDD